jgi:hypothetical protein
VSDFQGGTERKDWLSTWSVFAVMRLGVPWEAVLFAQQPIREGSDANLCDLVRQVSSDQVQTLHDIEQMYAIRITELPMNVSLTSMHALIALCHLLRRAFIPHQLVE